MKLGSKWILKCNPKYIFVLKNVYENEYVFYNAEWGGHIFCPEDRLSLFKKTPIFVIKRYKL